MSTVKSSSKSCLRFSSVSSTCRCQFVFVSERRRTTILTMSNSSSLSSYSTFSSSSSKPGANAAQLSGADVCHSWMSPPVVVDAMTGRLGCHCGSVKCMAYFHSLTVSQSHSLAVPLCQSQESILTSQSPNDSLGPSSTFINTPLSLSQTKILCAALCAAPPMTYSESPENPIEFHGVRLTES